MSKRIYLAGPEVFLADALAIAEKKIAICRDHGLEGVFPLDAALDLKGVPPPEVGRRISASNVALMKGCDGLIANLTPFRGVSMDAGTAFEVGFMSALGRIVLGYSNVVSSYKERAVRYEREIKHATDPYSAGASIEDFGFAENLMIECAVGACGGTVVVSQVAEGTELHDLKGFAQCVVQARRLLDRVEWDAARPDTPQRNH